MRLIDMPPSMHRGAGRLLRTPLLIAALLAAGAGPAVAEESGVMISGASGGPNMLEDKFMVTLGTFILESNTTVRLDGPTGELGTDFDWDENFGGMDGSRFRVDGAWRFADRHKVRGMWFNFSRNRTTVFDEEVDWGDVTFPIDANVDGSFEFDIYELAYEYAFLKRENLELSGSFGFHLAQFEVGMSAEVDTGGGTGTAEIGDKGDLNAPLPVLGGRVIYRIHRDFWIDAMVQFFALEYDNVDGRLIDTRLGVTWQPKDWLGIGVGYNRFDMDVDVTKNRYTGKLDWVYDGPMIFYSVAF